MGKFQAVIVLFSLILVVLGAELVFRQNYPLFPALTVSSPILRYRMRPMMNSRSRYPGEFDVRYVTDEKGWRSHGMGPQVLRTKRILGLGDSFVFGWGVENQETYLYRLQEFGPRYDIMNAGVIGVGLSYSLRWFRQYGPSIRPHLTIVGISENDVNDDLSWGWYGLESGKLKDLHHPSLYYETRERKLRDWLRALPLYTYFTDRSHFLTWLRLSATRRLSHGGGEKASIPRPEGKALAKQVFSELIETIHHWGGDSLFVLIPTRQSLESSTRHSHLDWYREWCLEKKVDCVDMKSFLAGSPESYYFKRDGHWTAEAHRVAAAAIGATLPKKLQVPLLLTGISR